MKYRFLQTAADIINSGQSRCLFMTGNINDLFFLNDKREDYIPLIDFLIGKWDDYGESEKKKIFIHYDMNGIIKFVHEDHTKAMDILWDKWRRSKGEERFNSFTSHVRNSANKPFASLELLRQLCICTNEMKFKMDLIIVIQNANMIIPDSGDMSRLADNDRRRISVCREWFSDPNFMSGHNTVVMTCESRSQISSPIARMPQLLEVEIPSPNAEERLHFINWFKKTQDKTLKIEGSHERFAKLTAGLSIHALRQLLTGASHNKKALDIDDVVEKVETFIKSQIGEDVVEFKKPSHRISDLIGFTKLKHFIQKTLIPRIKSSDEDSISGAAIAGPLGSGKTYIFEAVASELDMPVLVLKNIRSQFYGQTDVIFERLRRTLKALEKVVIFVDEADTQFGGVGSNTHETERRLTGKIQSMMSDPQLKGKVIWLLMTARIHRLSPDIRRPGRVGDLIIPVLDPEEKDKEDFAKWMLSPVIDIEGEDLSSFSQIHCDGFSSANFASLRSELIAVKKAKKVKSLTMKQVEEVIDEILTADISMVRRYQTLQALVNCTRKSLLSYGGNIEVEPNRKELEDMRARWRRDIKEMEDMGIE